MYITQIKPLENGDYESVLKRSFSMCITQIKPLENRDYDSVLKNPPSTSNNASYIKKSEVCSEPLSKRGYEDVFHVYHTNQTGNLGNLGNLR